MSVQEVQAAFRARLNARPDMEGKVDLRQATDDDGNEIDDVYVLINLATNEELGRYHRDHLLRMNQVNNRDMGGA